MYFLAAALAPSACFLKASFEAKSEACWESRVARRRNNLQHKHTQDVWSVYPKTGVSVLIVYCSYNRKDPGYDFLSSFRFCVEPLACRLFHFSLSFKTDHHWNKLKRCHERLQSRAATKVYFHHTDSSAENLLDLLYEIWEASQLLDLSDEQFEICQIYSEIQLLVIVDNSKVSQQVIIMWCAH